MPRLGLTKTPKKPKNKIRHPKKLRRSDQKMFSSLNCSGHTRIVVRVSTAVKRTEQVMGPLKGAKIRKFKKLNEENFDTWTVAMKATLRCQQLWDSDKDLPIAGADSHYEILMGIEESNYVFIKDLDCGSAAWATLQTNFRKDGLNAKLQNLTAFINMKWTEGSVHEHCQRF